SGGGSRKSSLMPTIQVRFPNGRIFFLRFDFPPPLVHPVRTTSILQSASISPDLSRAFFVATCEMNDSTPEATTTSSDITAASIRPPEEADMLAEPTTE